MSEPFQRHLNRMVWQRDLTELSSKCHDQCYSMPKFPRSIAGAESVSTAVYLRNRCPTKAVMGKTPYEAWHGQPPAVDHLRVFGCDAYAHVPKDERRKLDLKVKKCVLLGYSDITKGYRLYDPEKDSDIQPRCTVWWKLENRIKHRLQFNHKMQWRCWQASNQIW